MRDIPSDFFDFIYEVVHPDSGIPILQKCTNTCTLKLHKCVANVYHTKCRWRDALYNPMIIVHGKCISSHFIFRAIKNNEYCALFDEYPTIQL